MLRAMAKRKPESSAKRGRELLPVVALGASAGGLEALRGVLTHLPPHTGAAFVVLQHLKSDAPSQLAEILGRYTSMPTVVVEQPTDLEPDHLYVIPPAHDLVIAEHRLQPVERGQDGHAPIDRFFRSLAAAHGELAVGVVLSGMGSDGTLGLKAIVAAGGLAMVQTPEEADFRAMPANALASRVAEHGLSVAELGEEIGRYLKRDFIAAYRAQPPAFGREPLRPVMDLLRAKSGHDFTVFKRQMLSRRIARRMSLCDKDTLDHYIQFLRDDDQELARLYRDLLVGVTDFYRDPKAYDVLEDKVLKELVASRPTNKPLRAWVAACATGEEAYSVAMSMAEAVVAGGRGHRLQLFATDVDEAALDVARAGAYPYTIAADISAHRLRRYFYKDDDHYLVSREMRESIVFAPHNLVADPPYSKLDLVCCRNLLIYLDRDVQSQVLEMFHFVLNDGGYLFLGNAETVGDAGALFEPVDKTQRLFKRNDNEPRRRRANSLTLAERSGGLQRPPQRLSGGRDVDRTMQHILLRDYVPACALINRRSEILCAYGPTERFLGLPAGRSSLDIVDMAVPQIRAKLRAVISEAVRDNRYAQLTAVRSQPKHGARTVRVGARPLPPTEDGEGLLLVTFEEAPERDAETLAAAGEGAEERLASELRHTQEELQGTIRALENSNEDLKSSNEEIMSMNEELQSTNEELETSKEELQSLNEEMNTVNSELRGKVGELERAHDDLNNLFAGTQVATLFLGPDLRIKRYTPATAELMSLIASDVGRPITDITRKFEDPEFVAAAQAVLDDMQSREREVRAESGRWFIRRMLPYRTRASSVEGVVVTFLDVTPIKAAADDAQRSAYHLRLLADAIPALIAYVDAELNFVFVNAAHQDWFGVNPLTMRGLNPRTLYGEHNRAKLAPYFEAALAGRAVSCELSLAHRRLGERELSLALTPRIEDDAAEVVGFYALATDITDTKRDQRAVLERQLQRARARADTSMGELASSLAHQMAQPLGAISAYTGAIKRSLGKGEGAPEQAMALLDKVGEQTQIAAASLRSLRDLVARGAGDTGPQQVGELLRRVAGLMEPRMRELNVEVSLDIAEGLPPVSAVAQQLDQAVIHLVENALEAMAEAPVRELRLSASRDGEGLLLAVEDTGTGIPTGLLNEIFEPFHSGKPDGLGLGLAVCRSVAESHGGRLWAESVPRGGGSSFYLWLPAAEAGAAGAAGAEGDSATGDAEAG